MNDFRASWVVFSIVGVGFRVIKAPCVFNLGGYLNEMIKESTHLYQERESA